jgi:hypothetical protein
MLDSLRPFVYDKSVGGTAAGGVDAYLPIQMTALSNLAYMTNKIIIGIMNPMIPLANTRDREIFEDLASRIESSVMGLFAGTDKRSLTITMRGPSYAHRFTEHVQVPNVEIGVRDKRLNDAGVTETVIETVKPRAILPGLLRTL